MRELLAIDGLAETTTDAFRRRLIEVADSVGLEPSYLAGVIRFESSYKADIRNPLSGATGLIQFLPSTARTLGTTVDELALMTAEEQLGWVGKYYERVLAGRRITSVQDHYLAVFAGSIGASPGQVLFASPIKAYAQNKALDTSGDGTITAAEATAPVERLVEKARARPVILVDMAAAPATPAPALTQDDGAALAVGLFGALVLGARRLAS